jgi:UDPglucose 6-dehydrogenase
MRVGIIGMGTVGRTISEQFGRHSETVEYDLTHGEPYPQADLVACHFAVICVSSPSRSDGGCDVSMVEEAVRRVPVDYVLIKSTIAPGTTDRLIAETGKSICFSPEYIGESEWSPWNNDAASVPFFIIGGVPATRTWFLDRLAPILGPDRSIHACNAIEAELIKYMENSFLATKLSFVNEFYEICHAFGADWHAVREGWLRDPRIGRSHTVVFPDDRGFGGRCLPKDVTAIIRAAGEVGYQAELLREVIDCNHRFRKMSSSAIATDGPPLGR